MKPRSRALAMLLACVGMIAGCKDQGLRTYLKPYIQNESDWQLKELYPAICRLEAASTVPMEQRLCPDGPGTGGGAPPVPPEFPD